MIVTAVLFNVAVTYLSNMKDGLEVIEIVSYVLIKVEYIVLVNFGAGIIITSTN